MRPTLFEFAGGEPAFLALATAHHARCIADPELNHPFSHPDRHPRHVERLAAYWAEVMGGPPSYSRACGDQTSVLQMHSGNGDMGDLGERFLRCFDLAADDADLPADPDFRAALHAYMRWAVDDVLSYSPEGTVVAAGAAMPRWGWDGLEPPASPRAALGSAAVGFAAGPPLTDTAVRLVLLGSGELGREVAIEALRLGCEVLAVDRYAGAPAMQVAQRHAVIDMTDAAALRAVLQAERERPCARLLVVPELEAIATPELQALEAEGLHVVPTARAARLTMDREGIRRLVAEELGLPTCAYRFCHTEEEVRDAVAALGTPCVIKPVMSSSGKGQSVIHDAGEVAATWAYAQRAGRAGAGRVIVEAFVAFDYEITLLTIRHAGGTSFCAPIGHLQESGDYRESWQPHPMAPGTLDAARELARRVTDALGGTGIFGVELFVRGEEVLFSEVSPRPHDTGMTTMVTQGLSEFALHVRAILGLPVPAGEVALLSAGASAVCLATAEGHAPTVAGVAEAMAVDPSVDVRVFAKPDARPNRRMAVALARGADAEAARLTARAAAACLRVD